VSSSFASIAANRHTEPARLSKDVRGELDWIVMKALEKDRNRRYETASGLAADIERHLHDEPVEAGPPSAAYRLRKFAKRNKAALFTLSLVVAALLTGTGVATWQAVVATRAKHAAVAAAAAERVAKETAEAREAETQAVLDFVQNKIFAAASPEGEHGGLGREVTLRTVVDAALPFVETSFAKQPRIEARLRMTLGVAFADLGDAGKAAEQFEKARTLYRQSLGPDHPNTLSSMFDLANSYFALGRYADALKLFEETLALRQAKLGPYNADTLYSRLGLAKSYAYLGRSADAGKLTEETLALMKTNLGPEHRYTLHAMGQLALRFQPAEDVKLLEETLALMKAKLGPEDIDTLATASNLALFYSKLGRPADAIKLSEETLARMKAKLGPDHPYTLVSVIVLADSYGSVGRYADALKLTEETLARMKAKLGPEQPYTLQAMYSVACCYFNLGRYGDALKLFEETLALRKAKLGPEHPDTFYSMLGLADCYGRLGRHAEALKLNEEAFALEKIKLGADNPATLQAMYGMASSLVHLDRSAEAWPIIVECQKRAEGQIVDPKIIRGLITLRLRHFQKTNDAAGCRAAAEMYEKQQPVSLYNAACYRAVTAAVVMHDPKTPGADASRLAKEEADRAMVWLTKAVAAGRTDAQFIKQDADFEALRDRDDFRKLVAKVADKDIAAAREAVRLEPKNGDRRIRLAKSLNDRAWDLVTNGDPALRDAGRAVKLAQEAVELTPNDQDDWNTLGVAQYRAGNWNEAITALQKFRTLRTNDSEWSNPFFLAMANWQLGNKEEARRWREKAVKWMDARKSPEDSLRRYRAEMEELMKNEPKVKKQESTKMPN
jgi:tetratricopeptide (TPR) repeat protein